MLGALLCILLVGCSRDAKASSTVKEAVELEQTANNTVIGRKDDGRLEYLDMTSDGAIRTVSFSERQEVRTTSIDLTKSDEMSSSDEKWTALCHRNAECQINKVADPSKSFSVLRKGMLTPLYWSPDGRFVFFVRQGPTWRLPPRCSLEDERDVTVYDLTQGREDIVSTVCGGFPYGGLRWYKLMADASAVDLKNGNLSLQVPILAARQKTAAPRSDQLSRGPALVVSGPQAGLNDSFDGPRACRGCRSTAPHAPERAAGNGGRLLPHCCRPLRTNATTCRRRPLRSAAWLPRSTYPCSPSASGRWHRST
jgi:hypothetical protein